MTGYPKPTPGVKAVNVVTLIVFAAALLLSFSALFLWGCPQYQVYSKRKKGEAQLAEAQSNRTIAVLEAKAKEESAEHYRATDSIRAVGVAAANRIIGHSLRDNPEYLTWLWVEALKEGQHDVIYVPTENQMPLMEAGRLGNFGKVK